MLDVPLPDTTRLEAMPDALFANVRLTMAAVPVVTTSSWNDGLAVPMPTLPLALMSTELVGAPGRMRSGRREPPVTSRTNQLASFAPMSQVCAVKPPPLVCSWRMAGVSVAVMWSLRPGEELPKPTFPELATKNELVG